MKSVLFLLVSIFAFQAHADYDQDLQKAYTEKLASAKKCLAILSAGKHPDSGRDVVKFSLDKNGSVTEVEYQSNNPDSQKYGVCIEDHFKKTQFPPPPGNSYSFEGFIEWSHEKNESEMSPEAAGLVGKIRGKVKKNIQLFQSCYDAYIKKGGDKEGQVVLSWAIDETGKASHVMVKEDSIQDALLSTCLLGKLTAIEFPKAAKNSFVEIERYPLNFSRTPAKKLKK